MGIKAKHIFVLVLAAVASAALAADLWYEDNNLGKGGGMPPDFVEKFHQPESFRQATGYINVYLMRANVLEKLDDQFLTTLFLPYLRKNNIKLAINDGGATWTQANMRETRVTKRNIELLKRLKRLGVQVDYISLQSVLSKTLRSEGKAVEYPLSKRIEDIVAYSKAVRAIYPQVAIGIIDALPSHGKDYQQPYRLVRDALAQEGMSLSYIHLDMPFEITSEQRRGITWKKLREVESYVEDDLGLRFGYFTTSRKGGNTSSREFHERVMGALVCYTGVAGGTPGDFIVASWFPHPQKTIPENATGDDYPAMRTVLEFGRQLEQIQKAGASWAQQYARAPGRRATCTTQ